MPRGTRIYVGNLPRDVNEADVRDKFGKFGKVVDLLMKDSYCFLQYDDDRDADDACKDMDGYKWRDAALRVEVAKEKRDRRDDRGGDRFGGDRFGGDRYGGDRYGGDRYGGPPRDRFGGGDRDRFGGGGRFDRREEGPPRKGPKSTGFRLLVNDLPSSASWQDLKDHARNILGFAAPYAEIYRYRGETIGVLEYENKKDLDDAYDKLHKTSFSNRYDRDRTITVKIDDDSGTAGGRGRSRSRSPRRKDSRSPRRDSRSRSRSRSPRRDSPARSRSRSPAKDAKMD